MKRPKSGCDSKIVLVRIGEPNEYANNVLIFSSPAASLITGSKLLAEGGRTRAITVTPTD